MMSDGNEDKVDEEDHEKYRGMLSEEWQRMRDLDTGPHNTARALRGPFPGEPLVYREFANAFAIDGARRLGRALRERKGDRKQWARHLTSLRWKIAVAGIPHGLGGFREQIHLEPIVQAMTEKGGSERPEEALQRVQKIQEVLTAFNRGEEHMTRAPQVLTQCTALVGEAGRLLGLSFTDLMKEEQAKRSQSTERDRLSSFGQGSERYICVVLIFAEDHGVWKDILQRLSDLGLGILGSETQTAVERRIAWGRVVGRAQYGEGQNQATREDVIKKIQELQHETIFHIEVMPTRNANLTWRYTEGPLEPPRSPPHPAAGSTLADP